MVDKLAKLSKISSHFHEKDPEIVENLKNSVNNKAPSNREDLKILNISELSEENCRKIKPILKKRPPEVHCQVVIHQTEC